MPGTGNIITTIVNKQNTKDKNNKVYELKYSVAKIRESKHPSHEAIQEEQEWGRVAKLSDTHGENMAKNGRQIYHLINNNPGVTHSGQNITAK